ncbi:reverse transcriptase family protein [Virgibacillus natechei]
MIIIFIYKENFFYDYVLNNSVEQINKAISDNKELNYYTVKAPKKNGVRVLNCIRNNTTLYHLQSSLKNNFLNKIPIAEPVYGFVKERSYSNFLAPHIWENNQERFYLRLDIKDFFGSINADSLKEVLKYYFKADDKASREMVEILIEIISLNDALPQGAVTSPVVSNIVFRQLDLRIQKYCKKLNVTYSRYADDLLFSSTNNRIHKSFFTKMISAILKSRNFKINASKTKYSITEISLNGFVVGSNIRISRGKLRDLKRVLFIYHDKKPNRINDFLYLLNSNDFNGRSKVNGNYFLNNSTFAPTKS